ncbi:replicative DNA helicase [Candidatus Roizmanbacteria bacterium RIFCSPHIGHO2_12_FULL_41_11]|uniref:Replicative DNA helicase n=2 Tax=Candidatus Roizmaniibacteriota TaxID=1752723 RepID=A0A1F7J734_9BACT|nr:MAG: replicative DNA helicase [Candidatus Roizmanbacteria bacterium RIFCSPHIGHO2_12_FULL_41_11]OGK51423.1 MAG: replicative DNA helicase [Candidatus Roizmanbacteria bacterium RIFCSPLOWO2_01_FULL_41_22]
MSSTAVDALKVPPHDLEAEKSVLGAVLIDSSVVTLVAEFLRAPHFYIREHQIIYEAMLKLFEKQKPVDIVTLKNQLSEDGTLKKIGGASYLSDLINVVPTSAYIEHYGQIVKAEYTKRKLIEISSRAVEKAFSRAGDVKILIDEAESDIFSLAQEHARRDFIQLKEIMTESFERLEEFMKSGSRIRGVATGFSDLDKKLSGLIDSNLIVLAARPGIGKTSFALNIALHAGLIEKKSVGFFSLEMSKEELVDRLLVGQADIDAWKLKTAQLSATEQHALVEAMGDLSEAPIYIDDTPGISVLEMRTKARKLKAEKDLKLLIVDYLQLADSGKKFDSRVQEVSYVSQGLKNLARELKIPVLAVSQLSRAVEQRGSKKPQLSDLRESGCLAEDSLIMRADTGELLKIGDLAKKDLQLQIPVYSLDDDWKLSIRNLVKAFPSGRKPLFELKIQSGRTIKVSANHPFRCLHGWTRLDELKIDDRIAVQRTHDITNPNNDTIPKEAWKHHVQPAKDKLKLSWRDFSKKINMAYCGSALFKNGISRKRMKRIADSLADNQLKMLAESDVYWDRIVSIEPLGVEEVYDVTVEGTHNFIANDIIVHNSIEQDSDVVMFIYHEDDTEDLLDASKRIVKLYIAKHRNGPTGELDMLFRGDRVRFYTVDKTG